MKKYCKVLSILLLLALTFAYLSILSFADEVLVEGDYEYTVTDGEVTITKYIGEGGDVTVPSTLGGIPVIHIGSGCFKENLSVTSVVVPEGIRTIQTSAFYLCSYLNQVILPETLTYLGSRSFYYCSSLTDIVLPPKIHAIREYTFAGCGLINITLPENLRSIGQLAFAKCKNLTEIEIPKFVNSIHRYAFQGGGMPTEPPGILPKLVFLAYPNTIAQSYAEEYGIPFIAITEYTTETLGDINGDESINAEDALLALQHSVRLIDLRGDSLSMADMNQDDSINAQDALQILQLSVGL